MTGPVDDTPTEETTPTDPPTVPPAVPATGRGMSLRTMSLLLGGATIAAVGLLLFNSCQAPRTTLNAPAGAASTSAAVTLTDQQRRQVAEDFVRTVSTFGAGQSVRAYTEHIRTLVPPGSRYLTYPMTGKAWARCQDTGCASTVTALTSSTGSGGQVTVVVDTTFTSSGTTRPLRTTWTLMVSDDAEVTSATGSTQD